MIVARGCWVLQRGRGHVRSPHSPAVSAKDGLPQLPDPPCRVTRPTQTSAWASLWPQRWPTGTQFSRIASLPRAWAMVCGRWVPVKWGALRGRHRKGAGLRERQERASGYHGQEPGGHGRRGAVPGFLLTRLLANLHVRSWGSGEDVHRGPRSLRTRGSPGPARDHGRHRPGPSPGSRTDPETR